ncbi:MAG: LamG domain-containing protein [Candidatus Marsarchaeota archaeon]|nr:LamG domain-containing protein [Candidatus Marsarchaeota archaeon]
MMIKSQSAMEYLMTYGWAILIIAVVLAALFELGVFNPMTFAPKASPGSCQVVRPEGAGTTNFISLEGECNGELPQYVASCSDTNDVCIPTQLYYANTISVTVSAWVYLSKADGYPGNPIISADWTPTIQGGTLGIWSCAFGGWSASSATSVPVGTWENVIITLTPSGLASFYLDGSSAGQASIGAPPNNQQFRIGAWGNGCGPTQSLNGSIANIQIYNTTLSSNDIQALYQEGIGGAPINIQSLVSWWPLNGNANDYSGNNNNGVPNGVTYTNNWYSGYSAP